MFVGTAPQLIIIIQRQQSGALEPNNQSLAPAIAVHRSGASHPQMHDTKHSIVHVGYWRDRTEARRKRRGGQVGDKAHPRRIDYQYQTINIVCRKTWRVHRLRFTIIVTDVETGVVWRLLRLSSGRVAIALSHQRLQRNMRVIATDVASSSSSEYRHGGCILFSHVWTAPTPFCSNFHFKHHRASENPEHSGTVLVTSSTMTFTGWMFPNVSSSNFA